MDYAVEWGTEFLYQQYYIIDYRNHMIPKRDIGKIVCVQSKNGLPNTTA